MCGIYKITCIGNNKVYIGQSVSIKQRWNRHQTDLKRNCHSNKYLQRAYNLYGKDSFVYEILELCPRTQLNEREKFYIQLFDSYKNGFNCDIGGSDISGENNPMYQKKGKESPRFIDLILQLDEKGEIINKFESANLASKEINGQAGHILDCLKTWKKHSSSSADTSSRERMTHKGYQWIYQKDYEILKKFNYDFSKKRNKKSLTIQDLVDKGALGSDV